MTDLTGFVPQPSSTWAIPVTGDWIDERRGAISRR
jgi:hypothetical protein